ncbi:MAG: DUF2975 domain-containing protein [Peptostreptococcaceae bacterium]
MKNKNSKILNGIVLCGIFLTLLILVSVPLVLSAMFKNEYELIKSNFVSVITILVYVCAIPYVMALVFLKRLCKLMSNKNPFSREIPSLIKKIGMCAFSEVLLFNGAIVAMYFIYDIYLYAFTIMSCIIVSFVSIAIGFFSLVSASLFEMSIEIKEENDKTI